TDDAGSVSNKVMLSITLRASDIAPTTPPSAIQDLAMLPADIKSQIPGTPIVYVTNNPGPHFIGTTNTGVTLTVYEFDSSNNPVGTPFTTTSDPNTGAFGFQFVNPQNVVLGEFHVYVKAAYTQYPGLGSTQSNTVYFEINNTVPGPVTNFHLFLADDTGIA